MKLWLLYNGKFFENSTSPQRMADTATSFGIETYIFYHDRFAITIENNAQILYYNNEIVEDLPDIVFCRGYNNNLLHYFERHGCMVINSADGMNTILNKYKTHIKMMLIDDVLQPKTLHGKLSFHDLAKQLKTPFIMKDNFGGKGERVFLIDNEQKYLQIQNSFPSIQFIYQTFIHSSSGKDLRCYVIGQNVYAIVKQSNNASEFRSNISQGGNAYIFNLDEAFKTKIREIAKLLKIEIGSIDFLFGNNNELIFCEANGNAAFRAYSELGINLRREFFKYIKEKYGNYKNVVQHKKKLTSLNNSFEVIKGAGIVLFSAPHNVKQIRELKTKSRDIGTGHLLLNVANSTHSHAIIRTNCTGCENEKNDDPNYYTEHPYREAVQQLILKHNLKYFIDLHSMKKIRPQMINIGIDGGKNIQQNFSLLEKVKSIFNHYGFHTSIDHPFSAGEKTLASFVAKTSNIFSLQIEINSKLIHLKDDSNQFGMLSQCFAEIAQLLNSL